MTTGLAQVAIEVSSELDVYRARHSLRGYLVHLGFSAKERAELAIVASELTWNILKHASRGTIELMAVEDAAYGCGVRLTAIDEGPPIRDFATALLDGHDDSGPIDPILMLRRSGIGGGLGAVARLSDSIQYWVEGNKKFIAATKYCISPRGRVVR